MDDDLRYPKELIASPHKELEISQLPAGRGSMPGKPHEEVEETELISGRGLIP
ncbi:hypothetical protein ES705_43198 [subsurface metagenome]